MERESRNTSVWLDNDMKGSLLDKSVAKKVAPGSYNTSSVNMLGSHLQKDDVGVLADK
jgi:hypothetical protein